MSNFKCSCCGSELSITKFLTDVNSNDDILLWLEIQPCVTCTDNAWQNGKEDAHNG